MSRTKRNIICFAVGFLAGVLGTFAAFGAESPDPAVVLKALKNIRQLEEQESGELKSAKNENEALKRSLATNEVEAKALKQNEKTAIERASVAEGKNVQLEKEVSDLRGDKWELIAILIGLVALIGVYVLLKLRGLIPW